MIQHWRRTDSVHRSRDRCRFCLQIGAGVARAPAARLRPPHRTARGGHLQRPARAPEPAQPERLRLQAASRRCPGRRGRPGPRPVCHPRAPLARPHPMPWSEVPPPPPIPRPAVGSGMILPGPASRARIASPAGAASAAGPPPAGSGRAAACCHKGHQAGSRTRFRVDSESGSRAGDRLTRLSGSPLHPSRPPPSSRR